MRFFIAAITLILLSACSGNSKPASPLAKFEKGNQHLKNTCKEGAGSAGSCHALAKKYENPPSGLMPDFFNAGRYYQYAAYGYKKECIQDNYGFACLQLGNLYEKGKGGLPTDKTQAYKYHKKACDNPSMKRNQFCWNMKNHYKDYFAGIDKQKRNIAKRKTQQRKKDVQKNHQKQASPNMNFYAQRAYMRETCRPRAKSIFYQYKPSGHTLDNIYSNCLRIMKEGRDPTIKTILNSL